MANGQRSGLGRGLAAIIPGADEHERERLSSRDRLLHSIANAGFDLLEEGNQLGLCAYLHAPVESEPHLWLRYPPFGSLTATRAFRLFHGLAMMSNTSKRLGTFEWEGMHALFLRSSGPASDGLHVVGRRKGRFDSGSARIVLTICQAFADLSHQVQAGNSHDLPPVDLRVKRDDQGATSVRADVFLGGKRRRGRASAQDAQEAVARAVIAAVDEQCRYVDHRILPVEDQHAVLVVATDPERDVHVGLTMADGDPYQAVGMATLRCLLRSGATKRTKATG